MPVADYVPAMLPVRTIDEAMASHTSWLMYEAPSRGFKLYIDQEYVTFVPLARVKACRKHGDCLIIE